jgi:tagatose-1,6-bisphosphate aldolase
VSGSHRRVGVPLYMSGIRSRPVRSDAAQCFDGKVEAKPIPYFLLGSGIEYECECGVVLAHLFSERRS